MSISVVDSTLAWAGAAALARLIRDGRVDEVELTQFFLDRIARLNPGLNAYCTVDAGGALKAADTARMRRLAGEPLGCLHGIPVSIKDLIDTAGLRTTYGSTLFRDHVPTRDAVSVSRLRAAGAIVLGKTNTAEFEGGGNTVNPVFGATRNPWDTNLSVGGSSGGSGAAVAAGLSPLSLGTDLGGSLRIPASFCGVMGLRPTPGLVPVWPVDMAYDTFGTESPIAAKVDDLALALDVLAGAEQGVPLSAAASSAPYRDAAAEESISGLRVAVSANLGLMTVEPEIADVVACAAARLGPAVASIDSRTPDWVGGDRVVNVYRQLRMATKHGAKLPEHRSELRPSLVSNIEGGLALSGADIAQADRERQRLIEEASRFFTTHDVLVAAVTPVLPFPVEQDFPRRIAGKEVTDYTAWLHLTYVPATLGLPALAMPAGFSSAGLPIGLQLIGAWRSERKLLAVAALLERELADVVARRPDAVR